MPCAASASLSSSRRPCLARPAAGEAGLKKLARAVDAAACCCHNLLTDHLQPQLEQLAFRLGELRGLALCLPWRRITGLQPEQASWPGGGANDSEVQTCSRAGLD